MINEKRDDVILQDTEKIARPKLVA